MHMYNTTWWSVLDKICTDGDMIKLIHDMYDCEVELYRG